MLRLLICDDHTVVRRGLRAILTARHGVEVIGEAANGAEAVRQAAALQPDVILMDMLMPELNGVQAIAAIRQANPQARILVLTSFGEDEQIMAALRAGALGYLLKDSSPEELLEGIRSVAAGTLWAPPALAPRLLAALQATPAPPPAGLDALTERELAVLRLITAGLSNQEIADQLAVSVNTVRTHVSSLLTKLALENRTQAALLGKEQGL